MQIYSVRAPFAALSLVLAVGFAACDAYDAGTGPYPPPTGAITTVAYCAALAPSWVAFKDGDGAWTRAAGVANGGRILFRRVFTSPRGAIATVAPAVNGAPNVLRVLYGSPAELVAEGDTLRADCEPGLSRTWRGHVDGLATSEKAVISTGVRLRTSALPGAPDFEFVGVPTGPQDVLVARLAQQAGGVVVSGFILRRGVDAADGEQLANFDFGSAEAFAPATAALTIEGIDTGGASSFTELQTSESRVALPFLADQNAGVTRPYFAVPTLLLRPGDLQLLHVSTTGADSTSRTVDLYFRETTDRTLTLGAPVTPPFVGFIAVGNSILLRGHFDAQRDYDQSASLVLAQESALVSLSMTRNYLTPGKSDFEVVTPDLTTVDGFQEGWTVRPGRTVSWQATRIGGTLPLGSNVVPELGAVRRTATTQGILVP